MRNKYLLFWCLVSLACTANGQSPNDGLMMPKKQLCILAQYANGSWTEYWEGENKRENSNLGKFVAQSYMLMGNYGLSKRWNLILGVPYIQTKSDSYLKGQQGIQDLSLWVKYHPLEWSTNKGALNIMTTGGVSTPLTNYVNDLLPLSIGLRSRTASLRGIFNYTFNFGLYTTIQGGHTWRSHTHIDRDSYIFNNQLVYSDEVRVPNVADGSLRIGFIKPRFQTEIWIEKNACFSGDDIRYNDAPFPTNKMIATAAGFMAKGFITKQFALQASISQVLSGRNVGLATTYAAGCTYFFTVGKKADANAQ
ncbi:MAG: hypothetical protein JNJ57_14215 [Saprospiraceae bacterium]|nr:hypothetical protein [Saprospiraceae bacterium]